MLGDPPTGQSQIECTREIILARRRLPAMSFRSGGMPLRIAQDCGPDFGQAKRACQQHLADLAGHPLDRRYFFRAHRVPCRGSDSRARNARSGERVPVGASASRRQDRSRRSPALSRRHPPARGPVAAVGAASCEERAERAVPPLRRGPCGPSRPPYRAAPAEARSQPSLPLEAGSSRRWRAIPLRSSRMNDGPSQTLHHSNARQALTPSCQQAELVEHPAGCQHQRDEQRPPQEAVASH